MQLALAPEQNPFTLELAPVAALDQNPFRVYLASLPSPQSRRTMTAALESLAKILTSGALNADTLPWGQLRAQHTQALRATLMQTMEPRSVNNRLSALRGVLNAAESLGQMSAEELRRALAIKNVQPSGELRGRSLSPGELRALFGACNDGTARGARDAALLAILYMGGAARRSEAVALDVSDYDPQTGKITHRHGKGNKHRFDYLAGGAKAAVDAWLRVRPDFDGPLLLPVEYGGAISIRRLSDHAVYKALAARAEKAGVAEFTPHDVRRTAISDYLDAGVDIATVAKKAGHASVEQTARYDRRDERAIAAGSERLHVPYFGGDN
ncbi:MAG: site-specific integrase [Armatimonadetes bacterium]|nr:site-specific integrase [Armatimonadota bacterium]